MNTFAKIYVIGSNIVFVSVPMVWPIFGAKLSPILSFLLTLVWIIWNLIALAKFQKTSVPLTVPMFCPIMIALAFQTMLLSYVSSDSIARLLIGLGVLLFSLLTLAYFALSAKLFYVISAQTVDPLLSSEFRSFSAEFVSSVKQDVAYAGFWRRFLASLIDGTILGLAGSLVLVVTFIVFAAFAHKDLAAFFHSLRTVWSGTINGFAMGFVSPVAATTYWLCCLAGLSKVAQMTGLPQVSMLVSMLSLFIINCVAIIYYTLMESSNARATLGKQMLKLQVNDADGFQLTPAKALSRCVFKCISTGTFFLGFAYIGLSPRKQAIHDILSKSVVIEKPQGADSNEVVHDPTVE